MKKVFALILTAGVFAVVACGEGKKADATTDSAAAAQRADSLAATLSTDSTATDSSAAVTVDSAAVDTTKK